MTERNRMIAEVERYWRETGLSADTVAEMSAELEQHLADAELDWRSVEHVIGDRGRLRRRLGCRPQEQTGLQLVGLPKWENQEREGVPSRDDRLRDRDGGAGRGRRRRRTRR